MHYLYFIKAYGDDIRMVCVSSVVLNYFSTIKNNILNLDIIPFIAINTDHKVVDMILQLLFLLLAFIIINIPIFILYGISDYCLLPSFISSIYILVIFCVTFFTNKHLFIALLSMYGILFIICIIACIKEVLDYRRGRYK